MLAYDDCGHLIFQVHCFLTTALCISMQMFTSCYNGFIRLMDMERELFELVYAGDHAVFSLSQSPNDMNSLYFGEGNGQLRVWDARTGKSSSSWGLHQKRINTIDFKPQNTNIMTTSSTDGTACIWDLRKVGVNGSTALKSIRHERAVHSAYFSPSGRFLATTRCVVVDFNKKKVYGFNAH